MTSCRRRGETRIQSEDVFPENGGARYPCGGASRWRHQILARRRVTLLCFAAAVVVLGVRFFSLQFAGQTMDTSQATSEQVSAISRPRGKEGTNFHKNSNGEKSRTQADGSNLVQDSASRTSTRSRRACRTPARVRPPDDVTVDLELSRAVVRQGEPVTLTVRVVNNGREPVAHAHGGQRYDFWVQSPRGLIWLWSDWVISEGGAFQAFLAGDALSASEVQEGTVTWTQTTCSGSSGTVPRGRYVVRALWFVVDEDRDHLSSGWWSEPVPLRVR